MNLAAVDRAEVGKGIRKPVVDHPLLPANQMQTEVMIFGANREKLADVAEIGAREKFGWSDIR